MVSKEGYIEMADIYLFVTQSSVLGSFIIHYWLRQDFSLLSSNFRRIIDALSFYGQYMAFMEVMAPNKANKWKKLKDIMKSEMGNFAGLAPIP